MRLGNRKLFAHHRKGQGKILSLILLLSFLTAGIYTLIVIRPVFLHLAESKAKELAVTVIHRTISESLQKSNTDYNDIVVLERNESNSITAVQSNLTGISSLKSDLNLSVMDAISSMDTTTLQIPLGSLLGSELFAGTGPTIPFHVMPYGTAETDIITDFSDSGINQTKLDVSISVKADLSILIPTIRKKSTVETTVPILQTIIVGSVPNSYTHVDRDGYAFEDDVLQLAE